MSGGLCDKTADSPNYAKFGISRGGGEDFYLIASNSAIVDSVTTVAMDADQSMALSEARQWVLSTPTPGQVNAEAAPSGDIYNPGVSPVRITEFASNSTFYVAEYGLRCDWIELCNTSGADADLSGYALSDHEGNDKYIFPEGSFIPAGGYLVVPCSGGSREPNIAPFSLSQQGGEAIVLTDPSQS